jgi:hypothetical protein
VGLKERNHFESLGINGRIILKRVSKKYDRMAWIGRFMLLRTGTNGGIL